MLSPAGGSLDVAQFLRADGGGLLKGRVSEEHQEVGSCPQPPGHPHLGFSVPHGVCQLHSLGPENKVRSNQQ